MPDNNIQAIEDSFSLAYLWKDLAKDITGLNGIPASLTLADYNWNQMKPFKEKIVLYPSFTDISPDKKRIFMSYDVTDPGTYEDETYIAVFMINGFSLKKETEFRFKDLALDIEKEDSSTIKNYRCGRFMGNDHIAIAMANGILRILSIKDKAIFLEKKIGGLVETLTCSNTLIAASLFPGISEKLYYACGVKVYNIEKTLNKKRLEPCTIIPAHSFSILPHSLSFDPRGTTLLCKGSKIVKKGYINYIEAYSLDSKTLTTTLEEMDEDINQRISNFSKDKAYCRLSKQGFWVNNQTHQKIWEPRLPESLVEQGVLNSKLSIDGSQILCCMNGVLYHAQKTSPLMAEITDLGHVTWAHFLSGPLIILGVCGSYHFDIKIIDTTDFSIKSSLNNPGIIEWINRDGFDINGNGILLIADNNGIVRKLENNLMSASVIPQNYGPLRQVKADPFNHRDALLSASGAVIMVNTEKCTTKLRIGFAPRKPVTPGSGYHNIGFARDIDDSEQGIWMTGNSRHLIQFGLSRFLCMEKNTAALKFSDYIDKHSTILYESQMESPVCDSLRLQDHALILLQNGSVIKVDPFCIPDTQGPSNNREKFPSIIENITSPRGLTRISDHKIVVWTKDSLIYYKLSDELQILKTKTKNISGIYNIKWDDFNQRMVISFSRYLGFWSLALKQMYRLYLLSGKGHLIHVPFPAHLKTDLNCEHPGYFWSNVNCLDLFEVKTIDRKIVTDKNIKKQFIDQYFNRFMVETAIENYDVYCTCLGDNNYNVPKSSYQFLLGMI
jgi:hypothetical protein